MADPDIRRVMDAVRDYGVEMWRYGVAGCTPGPSTAGQHIVDEMAAWDRVRGLLASPGKPAVKEPMP